MKILLTFIFLPVLIVAVSLQGCSTSSASAAKADEIVMGPLARARLGEGAFHWFAEGYSDYSPNVDAVRGIGAMWGDTRVLIVLGTWCGDSKREGPRFFKIVDQAGLPAASIELYGVDRKKEGTDATPSTNGIEKVPTFIFLRDGREIGRIVESPAKSLEQDMLEILSRRG